MDKISTVKELDAAISFYENKQAQEEISCKEQFEITYESIKPINFIRRTFKELVTAPDFKEDLINTSFGLASGYLSKKIAIGSSNNPIKQILGSFLQMGVSGVVSKNADDLRSKFMDIISVVFKKNAKPKL